MIKNKFSFSGDASRVKGYFPPHFRGFAIFKYPPERITQAIPQPKIFGAFHPQRFRTNMKDRHKRVIVDLYKLSTPPNDRRKLSVKTQTNKSRETLGPISYLANRIAIPIF